MTQMLRNPWTVVQAAALPATAMFIVAFFAAYALFGSNGVLAWGEYSKHLEARRGELLKLERERIVLSNRVALLDPRHADRDLAEELARRELGVARPDEIIVPLR